jgi:hypothetical protein
MGRKATPTRREGRTRIEKQIRGAMNEIVRRHGWTKGRLAREVDEDPTTVGRWLDGSTTMPAWFVGKFCDAFGVGVQSVIQPVGGVHGVEVGRRAAQREIAKLLRRVSHHLAEGHVPEVSP